MQIQVKGKPSNKRYSFKMKDTDFLKQSNKKTHQQTNEQTDIEIQKHIFNKKIV